MCHTHTHTHQRKICHTNENVVVVEHFKGIHLQIIHSLSILMLKRETTTNEKKIGNFIMESINVLFISLSLALTIRIEIHLFITHEDFKSNFFSFFLIHLKSLIWLLIIFLFFLLALTLQSNLYTKIHSFNSHSQSLSLLLLLLSPFCVWVNVNSKKFSFSIFNAHDDDDDDYEQNGDGQQKQQQQQMALKLVESYYRKFFFSE